MLPTRLLLAVLASAIMASAAPHHLVHRQDEGEAPAAGDDVVESPTPTDIPEPVDPVPVPNTSDTTTVDPPTTSDPSTGEPVPSTPYGGCTAACNDMMDDLLNCDSKVSDSCKDACGMWSEGLKGCATCMATDTTADQASKDRVNQWTAAAAFCPTTGSGYQYGACGTCKPTLDAITAACTDSTSATCADTCKQKDALTECQQCLDKDSSTNDETKAYVADQLNNLPSCEDSDCSKACESAAIQVNEHCAGPESCKSNVCDGAGRESLDKCQKCDPSYDMGGVYEFCKGGDWPEDCVGKCNDILDFDYESCKNLNPSECAAMCPDKNLNAYEQCVKCTKESKYSVYDAQSVEDSFNSRRSWCKNLDNKDNNGGDPPITVTVDGTITVVVPNRTPPTPIAPNARPTGKTGGITVNTGRPVTTSRRPSGSTRPTSGSSASQLPLGFGGMGFGTALGVVIGILVVAV